MWWQVKWRALFISSSCGQGSLMQEGREWRSGWPRWSDPSGGRCPLTPDESNNNRTGPWSIGRWPGLMSQVSFYTTLMHHWTWKQFLAEAVGSPGHDVMICCNSIQQIFNMDAEIMSLIWMISSWFNPRQQPIQRLVFITLSQHVGLALVLIEQLLRNDPVQEALLTSCE